MTDTRRLRYGYVTVAMAMPVEMATMLRVQALLHHQSIGDYVTSLLPEMPDRFGGIRATRENALPKPATKAPGKHSGAAGAIRATPVSGDARADLWRALEALRTAQGWNDGEIGTRLGIKTRNISLWRQAGQVTSTQAEAVEKLLNQAQAKP